MSSEKTCPKCGSPMKVGLAPFRVAGIYIGSYRAQRCTICGYYYFLPDDYEAMRAKTEYVLVNILSPPVSSKKKWTARYGTATSQNVAAFRETVIDKDIKDKGSNTGNYVLTVTED